MTDICAGDVISATWWPESVRVQEDTDQLNVTSTAYVAGTPECSTTFVAPASGRVGVVASGELRNQDTAAQRVYVSFEIRLGSTSAGTLVQSGTDARGVSTTGDTTASEYMTLGDMSMVENLTAGSTYFIRAMHRVSGGTTNDVSMRRVCVIPMP